MKLTMVLSFTFIFLGCQEQNFEFSTKKKNLTLSSNALINIDQGKICSTSEKSSQVPKGLYKGRPTKQFRSLQKKKDLWEKRMQFFQNKSKAPPPYYKPTITSKEARYLASCTNVKETNQAKKNLLCLGLKKTILGN